MSATPVSDFCPYKGLQPYTEEDRRYFFGREQDQTVIASNLYAAPVTVLYGASGVGKSSVLLAGVVPQLKEDPQVAVVVFRTWQGVGFQTALKSEVLLALDRLQAVRRVTDEPVTIDLDLPFDEFLLACDRVLPFRGRILFVFDQFEEYFINPPHEGDGDFDAELARAINRREIPINVLFSMRDDGLSKLDRFQGRIPNLLGNLLRVEHLKLQDARRAIQKPLEVYNTGLAPDEEVTIEDSLIEALLDKARPTVHQEESAAKVSTRVNAVETPVLQILLTCLWKEERGRSSSVLRLDTFERRLGGAEHIIFTYLKDVMDGLTFADQEIAASVFQFLTTSGKTKIAHEPASLAAWTKLDESGVQRVLDRLSAREDKILRKVQVAGQPIRYEIFHDVLGGPLNDWRDKFVHERETVEAERRAAEAAEKTAREEALQVQLRRAEERAQSSARLRKLVAALGVMFVLALGTAAYAMIQRSQAARSAQQAEVEAKRANAEFARANESASLAQLKEQEARAAALEANRQAQLFKQQEQLAKAETQRANEQVRLADKARQRAVEQQRNAEQQRALAEAGRRTAELYREGTDLFLSGRYADAARKLSETLALYTRAKDSLGRARTLTTIGASYSYLGEKEKALKFYSEAATLFQSVRDGSGVAQVMNAIGELYTSLGDQERADRYLVLALAYYGELNDLDGAAKALNNLSTLYQASGNPHRSLEYLRQAVELNKKTGNRNREAETLANIGALYVTLGDVPQGVNSLEKARRIYHDVNNRLGEAQTLTRLGAIYDSTGDKDKAKAYYQRANDLLLKGRP